MCLPLPHKRRKASFVAQNRPSRAESDPEGGSQGPAHFTSMLNRRILVNEAALSFLPARIFNIIHGPEPHAAEAAPGSRASTRLWTPFTSCFVQADSCQEKQLHKQANKGLIRVHFAPLQERLVLAESEGDMAQPSLNSISPRFSIHALERSISSQQPNREEMR